MSRFLKNLLICSLPFILINILIASILIEVSKADDLTYVNFASSLDKTNRLDSLSGKQKIIIIGGSNTRFGYKSDILKKGLGIEPVNMGIHIALGLDYMLEEVENKLESGDILLISPEYQHFTSEQIYNGTSDRTDMYLIQRKWDKAFVHIIETHNFSSFYKLLRKRYKRRHFNTDSIPETMETRTKYNFYGDYVGHHKLPGQKLQRCDVSAGPNAQIIAEITERINKIRQRKVNVFIMPPPFPNIAYSRDRKNIEEVNAALLNANIGFSIPPRETAYPLNLFYDTEYHLNEKGATLHTQKAVEIIKNQLAL